MRTLTDMGFSEVHVDAAVTGLNMMGDMLEEAIESPNLADLLNSLALAVGTSIAAATFAEGASVETRVPLAAGFVVDFANELRRVLDASFAVIDSKEGGL